MDVPKEILIDAAVNALGYLAAGACTVLVYSMVTKRKAQPAAPVQTPVAVPVETSVRERKVTPRDAGQYVSLNRTAAAPAKEDYQTESGRRDRQAIMRIAREMLKAGASVSRIREVLPLSTAEVTLLAQAER